jgi:hypothetical protein
MILLSNPSQANYYFRRGHLEGSAPMGLAIPDGALAAHLPGSRRLKAGRVEGSTRVPEATRASPSFRRCSAGSADSAAIVSDPS